MQANGRHEMGRGLHNLRTRFEFCLLRRPTMNTLDTFAVLGQTVLGGVRSTTCAPKISGVRGTTCDAVHADNRDDVPLKNRSKIKHSRAGHNLQPVSEACHCMRPAKTQWAMPSNSKLSVVEPNGQAQRRSLSV